MTESESSINAITTSPGWFLTIVGGSNSTDLDGEVLQIAETLEQFGAKAVDVDREGNERRAFGLFDSPVALPDIGTTRKKRQLPEALHPVLPRLDQRPVQLTGLEIAVPATAETLGPPQRDIETTATVNQRLWIAPDGAFGSGLHPTTAMMLERAGRVTPRPQRVLDVGTGSGILALGLLRLGAQSAVGTDIAAVALSAAQANAARNGLSARFSVNSNLPTEETFDVVLANVRARVIERLMPQLSAAVAPGGLLLASGIRFYEDQRVVLAAERRGLEPLVPWYFDGWWCLGFRRP